MSIRNRAAAVACGLALAATALAPAAAFADGNTGTTEVTVVSEKSGEGGLAGDDQLAFEVPTQIAFAAKADGTLVGPSKEVTKIVNKSVFGIHVTKMAVEAANEWNLVADTASGTEANAIAFTLKGVQAEASKDLSTSADWNMGYAGSEGDSIEIASEGRIARVTADLKTPQKAATITWTLAAGNAR